MVDTNSTKDATTSVSSHGAGEQQNNFTIHNIYTKDVSFESPNSPYIFSIEWAPRVDFDLQMSTELLREDTWEVILNVTAKVALMVPADLTNDADAVKDNAKEERQVSAFLVEVKQAGVFSVVGLTKEHCDKILATLAPSILFPYVREQVSSLVVKGGFPQFILPSMNFELMYQQHLQEQKAKQDLAATAPGAASPVVTTGDGKTEKDVRKTPVISMPDPATPDPTFNTKKH